MSKKVLLAGTSFSAAPIYFALKQRGYDVAVCGSLPDDPCHIYADHSYVVDYSQRDLLLDLVKKEKVDYLCPSCNDYSYLSCSWVAEQCGLPGYDSYETTVTIHNKNEFRNFAEKHGIPIPKARKAAFVKEKDLSHLKFPLLVKPVDSFSGRGITKIYSNEQIVDAIKSAIDNSRVQDAVIEEFVEGTLHSHSAFIRKGRIVLEFFVDEFCTVYPYQVNCSNIPTSLSNEIRQRVRECIEEVANLLDLNDGLIHTQFITNGKDFWLIECMRRCPGDLYYKMVELSTNVDGIDLLIRPFLNEDLPQSINYSFMKYYARHTITISDQLVAFSFGHTIPAQDVQIVALKMSGEVLREAPYDKLAIIFAKFSNFQDLIKHTQRLSEYITIQGMCNLTNSIEIGLAESQGVNMVFI